MNKLCEELKEKNKCKTINCYYRCKEYNKLLCEKITFGKARVQDES